MKTTIFSRFRDLIHEQSGIHLAAGKETLLHSRISKRMRRLGIQKAEAYLKHIADDRSGQEMIELLDAISTNVTYFFREPDHFDQLRAALAHWVDEGQRRFRLWSAACSYGQEPYTMAMTALDAFRDLRAEGIDLRVLATDISTKVLAAAQEGVYSAGDLEKVALDFRDRYFDKLSTEEGQRRFQVLPALRSRVTFRRLNLSRPPFPMQGPLDVVFCRNVMIYFDTQTRQRLVNEIERLLRPGGLMMIGHAESLIGLTTRLTAISPSVYQKAKL